MPAATSTSRIRPQARSRSTRATAVGPQLVGRHGQHPRYTQPPVGIAVGAAGHVYAADKDHNRIAEFTRGGRFLRVFGHGDSGPGELHHPCCVAAEGLGPVYVADTGNSRIEKFTRDGRFLRALGAPGRGP